MRSARNEENGRSDFTIRSIVIVSFLYTCNVAKKASFTPVDSCAAAG